MEDCSPPFSALQARRLAAVKFRVDASFVLRNEKVRVAPGVTNSRKIKMANPDHV